MKIKITFALLFILSNFILNASTRVLEKELIYNYKTYYNFETNQVLNVEDLATRYLDDQYQYLWVAPPDPSVPLYQKGRPIALLNYKGFDSAFLMGLIAEEKDGVRTYPIWIYENSDDSKVVIANKDGKELISFDREINYSPDWFVFNELFDSVDRTKEQQDWLLACYDPSRIVMRYDLIVGEDDLMAYVWEQSQPDLQELFTSSITMAMRSSSVVSNLRFSAVEQLTNGVQLTVEWGEATLSDDELDFFVCNDLVNRNWFVEDTKEVDLSTNVYTWVDYNATNDTSRFYTCWTLYDTDGDGISDGRETLLYGTSITNSDTDGDGTYDIVEIYYGFNPKSYTPEDWDNDGLSNNFEYYCTNSISTNGIERLNAKLFDSDGDKLPDLFEVMYTNFNPCISNSFEGESLFGDPDEDELNNAEEMQYGTNPWLFDTDGDSTNDYDEVHTNHTDPLDSSNEYSEAVVNCIMELSAVDDNDYMLMIMGSSSTNIFLTSYTNNILFTNKICSMGQPLNVELSRNLEVESNYSPELTDSDVAFRVYTMDPWVITCYGWYYPYVRNSQLEELSSSPSPLTITTTSSPMTMETTAGGGAVDVSFYTTTMTVDIINEYDPYYCYIMCGCGSLPNPLNVTAQVTIDWMVGLSGTLYVFNPEPITCTAAAVANSIFNEDSDADTIIITDTIIAWYNKTKEAHFTLAMDVKNTLSSSECNQYYSFDVNVEVTSTNMESCSDDTGIPVYVYYSHGTWIIDSEMCPENVINILNSPNASVNIDFLHSVCANYGLNGTLDITADGNTDIFTLGDISREIDIEESPYSTSEGFSVIGCSDDLGDMIVDLEFSGGEYHLASYSLTSCALAVSNQSDNISMFTGLEDADNDGTNNVNDLDNAGDFMQILVKTHESATNAYFRLDFDDTKVKIWTEDSNAMITRTNSYIPNGNLIQSGHNYSYSDLFKNGAETNFYVQGLEAGEHDIDVVYMLDGVDLWTETVSLTLYQIDFVRIYDINKTANRTTRAVDATLRNARTYEDNERSDSEIDNNNPLLVAGGYGANMDVVEIALQCQFAPASLGEHILWDIQAYKDCGYSCLANKDFSTGSIQNINLFTSEQENRARTAGQYDKDFKIVVGLDQNKDGVLSHDEQFDMDFNIRAIGKEEYEYCRGQFNDFLIDFAWPLYPDMANFIDIFLDTDLIASYDWKLPDTVLFQDPYTQKNSLGCDALSYTLGDIKHYKWDDTAPICARIAESNDFWVDIIKHHILTLDINEWYSRPENMNVTNKIFISSVTNNLNYHGSNDINFENSLGECNTDFEMKVYTFKLLDKPQIAGFTIDGVITDFYDFDTHTGDDNNGHASRVQVCYNRNDRTGGKVYKATINMNINFVCLATSPYYDELELLRTLYLSYLWNL